MSDDETPEELLDEEDVLGEGDLDDDLFEEDGEEADAFDDDDGVLDDAGSSDEEEVAETPLPLDVSEDGDDELDGEPPVDLTAIEGLDVDDPIEVAAEDDEDPDDTIREGEFVCSSCHMAKRSSALADADEMLCRDCV